MVGSSQRVVVDPRKREVLDRMGDARARMGIGKARRRDDRAAELIVDWWNQRANKLWRGQGEGVVQLEHESAFSRLRRSRRRAR